MESPYRDPTLFLLLTVTLKNDVFDAQRLCEGQYELGDILHGKPSWISNEKDQAIWREIESLVKYFFDFFPTLFRKLTSNDLNPRIFGIEKIEKCFFFNFL